MTTKRNTAHGYSTRETQYVDARKAGGDSYEVAGRLDLKESTRRTFEERYRAETRAGVYATDASCPAYAKHEPHVCALIEAGGFFRWSTDERGRLGLPFIDARGVRVTSDGQPLGWAS